MIVLALVVACCFLAGSVGLANRLPELAEGSTGTIAFSLICGLGGIVLAVLGAQVDYTVRAVEGAEGHSYATTILAADLLTTLRDVGTLLALTLIAYLLAPKKQLSGAVEATGPGVD
jgi:hypothetical protein